LKSRASASWRFKYDWNGDLSTAKNLVSWFGRGKRMEERQMKKTNVAGRSALHDERIHES
jgi:hypothetical protein